MSLTKRAGFGSDATRLRRNGLRGWAAQPGQRTVAGELSTALYRLFGPDGAVGLTVAGRTDAGVHAAGQVCHVDVLADRWTALEATLLRRLAGLLPADVRVTGSPPCRGASTPGSPRCSPVRLPGVGRAVGRSGAAAP